MSKIKMSDVYKKAGKLTRTYRMTKNSIKHNDDLLIRQGKSLFMVADENKARQNLLTTGYLQYDKNGRLIKENNIAKISFKKGTKKAELNKIIDHAIDKQISINYANIQLSLNKLASTNNIDIRDVLEHFNIEEYDEYENTYVDPISGQTSSIHNLLQKYEREMNNGY